MGRFSDNPLWERFVIGAIGNTVYGGAEVGECLAALRRARPEDRESWYDEWMRLAERLHASGQASAARNHLVSAREAFLRATTYFHTAYLPYLERPVETRLVHAFDRESDSFREAAALTETPCEAVEIPFEGTTLPGYFCRPDETPEPRPTIIATNGYDSTLHMMYFGHALPAIRRGYNCLIFDGPGQGRPLFRQNLPMRPDWETVIRPVMDFVLARPEVDPGRIAILGWSLGGYLAPRAASGEPRLAACMADPGQWDLFGALKQSLHLPQEVKDALPDVDPDRLQPEVGRLVADPLLRWMLGRAMLVHGIDSLLEYVRVTRDYSLSPVVGGIRCPTLVTCAENDPVSSQATELYEALRCPKLLVRFADEEGAGDHCEALARSVLHQRAFDWLDEVLGVATRRIIPARPVLPTLH